MKFTRFLAFLTVLQLCSALFASMSLTRAQAKALAEEFGAAAGTEKNFLKMLKQATDIDYGFLYIVFGLKIRFFNSYRSEFQVIQEED